jgi:signal transduction histidine kinase/ActR/RegA family two-component response regulator
MTDVNIDPALAPGRAELRVVVSAVFPRDAELTRSCLAADGIACVICESDDSLLATIEEGAAAVILAAERLDGKLVRRLRALLARQPAWSDLPLVVSVSQNEDADTLLDAVLTLGNVTIIERPVRRRALSSVVRSALRARERQYEARALLGRLSDADKRKDAFLAMLGHELRNPLAAIHGAAALLATIPDKGERVSRVGDIVTRQVGNLQRLVDDLLDVARVTAGKIVLERQRIDLRTIAQHMVTMLDDGAREHRHRVDVDVPPDEVTVDADPVRLEQMIGNLLHNAIKYTPDGGAIRIVVEATAQVATVRVIDNGRGLPTDALQRIFEPFAQLESSLDRRAGGLGLGLPLVRGLTTLHGGTVEAHSAGLGTGCEFVIELPLAAPELVTVADGAPADHAGERRGLRVLLVDDFVDTLDVLRIGLEELGCVVDTATDGRTAIEHAAQSAFDVAFLDIGLPEVDGFEVARQLRAEPRTASLPLIAMSGYGREEDKRRSIAAGFDAHLVKPVDQGRLLQAFEEIRARTST